MSNIDLVRHFYAHNRLTAEGRAAILASYDENVSYVGVGKVSVQGLPALKRLWEDSIATRSGVSKVSFDIRHIAESGDTVLADVVATYKIHGQDQSFVISVVFKFDKGKIVFWQEHYSVSDIESAKRRAQA